MRIVQPRATDAVSGIADAAAAAGQWADAVDREARFPREALELLRRHEALSAYVPRAHGGAGVSLGALADACFLLARQCASAGMVFAMHQIQVVSLVHHASGAPYLETYLEDIVREQLLLASATSEEGTGGDLRQSIAGLTDQDGVLTLEKRCPTVSYGLEADDILVTALRAPNADRGDQVLVVARKAETTLESTGTWDVLGMRGTCSPGFVLRTQCVPEQVVPVPFADIAAQTMVPVTHILWAHVWLGIATAAVDRARAFVRAQARATPGVVPTAARRLSELARLLQRLTSEANDGLGDHGRRCGADEPDGRVETVGSLVRSNLLKINASELAATICSEALGVCGLAGYRNDSPYAIGRHLRDALSAPLMISNDRIHTTTASLLLVHKG
jgi:acyl-CoA dehydrogenase